MTRAMKPSGIEWIGEIPEGWEIAKQKPYINFVKGKNPENLNCDKHGLPYVGASSFETKQYEYYSTNIELPKCNLADTLVLWDGARAGIVDNGHNGIISSTVVKIGLNKEFVPKYYYWLSKTLQEFYIDMANGTTIPHMSKDFISNNISPLPPLPEQQAIADYLDWKSEIIDSTIEKQKTVIEKLKLYKQSVITEAVTKGLDPTVKMKSSGIEWIGDIPENWDIIKLKYEVNFQEGPGIMAYDFKDTGVPLLRLINVQNSFVNLMGCNFLDPLKVEKKWKHYKCKTNDLLISGSASNGIVCKVDENAEGAIPYTGLFRIWPASSGIFAEYVKWFLKSDLFDTQILLFQTGTTIHHFGPEHLRKMKLILPPLPEQQAIADYLDQKCSQIDNIIEQKQKLIEKLSNYKKSLIYECVTGKREVMAG